MRINNNISALNAWRNLTVSNTAMGKSLEKLSSGFRINRAADDASGLVISQSLRAQISGLKQATRNAQDGISLVQIAEGALNEVHSMLNRMRDLAVQSGNTATMDQDAIAAAQAEFDQLAAEIGRIAGSTSFGAQKLLDGTFEAEETTPATQATATSANDIVFPANWTGANVKNVTINGTAVELDGNYANIGELVDDINSQIAGTGVQVSAQGAKLVFEGAANGTNGITISGDFAALGFAAAVNVDGVPAVTDGGATFQVGAYAADKITVSIPSVKTDATGLNIEGLDLSDAATVIGRLDEAIKTVSEVRGQLGAIQNRFESTINNLQVTTENLIASESRIRDVDMASEMTTFTKQQVLLQAGTAMLGQANSLSQSVLSLLQ